MWKSYLPKISLYVSRPGPEKETLKALDSKKDARLKPYSFGLKNWVCPHEWEVLIHQDRDSNLGLCKCLKGLDLSVCPARTRKTETK